MPSPDERVANRFIVLVRHFFGLFFERESLSPQAESERSLAQVLGFLAVPSAFFTLLFRPFGVTGWTHVSVRYFFICYSMAVIAFVVALKWDALLPDRRDYQILTPLPLQTGIVFLAKVTALAIFVSFFLTVLNFFGILFWPGIDGKPDYLRSLGAHIVILVLSGVFSALAVAAIQGVLMALFRGAWLRRISILIQSVLLGALVMVLILTPLIGPMLRYWLDSPWVSWYPPYWFIGLYEQMRPAVRNAALSHLGNLALPGFAVALTLFIATYLPGYGRHARRAMDTPQTGPSGPGALRRLVRTALHRSILRTPSERAIFHFIGATIARSMRHRVFIAVYAGVGAAIAVGSFQSGTEGLLELPFTLSFILISGLRAAFNVPSELKANWTFQIGEGQSVREYLRATRKWILVCAVVPLFALMAPFEFATFRWTQATFHVAFGVAVSALLIEIMFIGFRKVPFTCAYFPGKVNLAGLSILYIFGFTSYSRAMAAIETRIVDFPSVAFALVPALVVSRMLVARLVAKYGAAEDTLDYESADPEVLTLDLRTPDSVGVQE